jgi:AraC family transcriptional regulator
MILAPARIETSKPVILAGRNGSFPIGPSPGIKDLWASFMADFGKVDGQVGYKSYGVCHSFDGRGNMDYMAAVEVQDAGQVPGYLFTLAIPARKVAVFAHHGPLAEISKTWALIFDQGLSNAKLTVAPGAQFEVYPEDMGLADATTPIEIHIPVS